MPTTHAVPPGTTTVIIEPARVLDLLDIVDNIAEQFEAKLVGDTPSVPVQDVITAQTALTQLQTDTDKLKGDIKNFDDRVQDLRQTTETLTTKAADANSIVKKDYTTAREDFTTLRDKALEDLRNTNDDIKKAGIDKPVPTTYSPTFSPYLKPNEYYVYYYVLFYSEGEYMVKKLRISIRGEEFCKDPAPIKCPSSDDILSTYNYITSFGSQYGIIIQASDSVSKWLDPMTHRFAPTFGLSPLDFASYDLATKAYSTMSHALATVYKLSEIPTVFNKRMKL